MKIEAREKWALLGASSGLGAAFAERIRKSGPAPGNAPTVDKPAREAGPELLLLSRKSAPPADFSKEEVWPEILESLRSFAPSRLFYFAGGGPWGGFGEKKWSSHLWAFRVNLLFPAFMLNAIAKAEELGALRQCVFIGSSVAEANPDPRAASYAAGKHGLRGLVTSVQSEGSLPDVDLRLFSPSYMDTPLLPANAWPRQAGLASSPREVAETLWRWIQDEAGRKGHLILR